MIKSIDKSSVHRISSGQVLVDLQTAVKELVENSLDAGATTIDVKFKDYGLTSFEVNDNGSGIAPEDYDNVAMKHFTSKLSTFEDLTSVQTFGFRGEALSSLCALSERVTITTSTMKEAPMGTILEFDKSGRVKSSSGKAARQRGTTVFVEGLFSPLPVRRKELQRNSKREFGKALTLLSAYALVPCTNENKGVRLSVTHIMEKGRKSDQIRTDGKPSLKAAISSLWGPKQVDSLAELSLDLEVIPEKTVLRRQANADHDLSDSATKIQVRGFISKFSPGFGRAGPDRQFFFINGRPCNPSKIQKPFNEVYRSFNANQSPFIVADFIVPTNSYDVNVSPDKRTILLHSENALVAALKEALDTTFAPARSTFAVQPTQSKLSIQKAKSVADDDMIKQTSIATNSQDTPIDLVNSEDTVNTDTTVDDAVETYPITQRSPSPTLAIPAGLFGSEEVWESPPEEPDSATLDDIAQPTSTADVRPRSPLPHTSSDSTGIPSIQPRRRSPSPLPPSLRIPSPTPAKAITKPVQMVLDTSNASWSMRPGSEEPARKKRRIDELKSTNPRAALRSQLLSFASAGSQLAQRNDGDRTSDNESTEHGNDSEEDELMEDDLEEDVRVDSGAKLGDTTVASSGPIRQSVTNNNKVYAAEAVIKDSLFLPELEEDESLHSHGQTQNDPIEVDVDVPDINGQESPSDDKGIDVVESGRNAMFVTGVSSALDASETAAKSGTSVSVEIVRTSGPNDDVAVPFSLEHIEKVWGALSSKETGVPHEPSLSERSDVKPIDAAAGLSNTSDEESAERELARVIDKEDFALMDIVGQFNLGFIIARRRLRDNKPILSPSQVSSRPLSSTGLDDLFIIDQHAADEKYNFETLQQTTKIDCQKLYQPRPLELTAADELLALENIDVLKNNGFEISIDESAEPSQGRIRLVAQPVSGSTNFDMKDLEELLHLMQDRPAGQKMVRCSKARAMFAMRACRKSVMIGMPLNRSQMTSIVRHMGTMDQPWNCPHGRPTMRHLTSLNDTAVGARKPPVGSLSRDISWKDLQ